MTFGGGFVTSGVSFIGKAGVTVSWAPTSTGYGLIHTEVNLGLGLELGSSLAGGVSKWSWRRW